MSHTRSGTLLKHRIPVRTFRLWDDRKPGFCETDTVSHDGGYAAGEYLFTLSLTDVCLCRPEFRALRNRTRTRTERALEDIREGFPVTPFRRVMEREDIPEGAKRDLPAGRPRWT